MWRSHTKTYFLLSTSRFLIGGERRHQWTICDLWWEREREVKKTIVRSIREIRESYNWWCRFCRRLENTWKVKKKKKKKKIESRKGINIVWERDKILLKTVWKRLRRTWEFLIQASNVWIWILKKWKIKLKMVGRNNLEE